MIQSYLLQIQSSLFYSLFALLFLFVSTRRVLNPSTQQTRTSYRGQFQILN